MISTYLGLGSNLDLPERQLAAAVQALQALPNCRLARVSSVYRSAPIGPGQQPDYLNAVVMLLTRLKPVPLLDHLQNIEQQQGRVRTHRWQARTLDIDILLYGDLLIHNDRLDVPHVAMQERNFVLQPLAEIAGDGFVLPTGKVLATVLSACPESRLIKTDILLHCAHEQATAEPWLDE